MGFFRIFLFYALLTCFVAPAKAECIAGMPCVDVDHLEEDIAGGDAACDAAFMNQMQARAYVESTREMAIAQQYIRKPDSALQYNCFDYMSHASFERGSIAFSADRPTPSSAFSFLAQQGSSYQDDSFSQDLGGGLYEENGSGGGAITCSFPAPLSLPSAPSLPSLPGFDFDDLSADELDMALRLGATDIQTLFLAIALAALHAEFNDELQQVKDAAQQVAQLAALIGGLRASAQLIEEKIEGIKEMKERTDEEKDAHDERSAEKEDQSTEREKEVAEKKSGDLDDQSSELEAQESAALAEKAQVDGQIQAAEAQKRAAEAQAAAGAQVEQLKEQLEGKIDDARSSIDAIRLGQDLAVSGGIGTVAIPAFTGIVGGLSFGNFIPDFDFDFSLSLNLDCYSVSQPASERYLAGASGGASSGGSSPSSGSSSSSGGSLSGGSSPMGNCDYIYVVSTLGRCSNAGSMGDLFLDLETLTQFDPRSMPSGASCDAMDVDQDMIDLAYNRDRKYVSVDVFDRFSALMDGKEGGDLCAPPVVTGVSYVTRDRVDFIGAMFGDAYVRGHKVCVNPQCYYDYQDDICVAK